jgi:hypothetical protein
MGDTETLHPDWVRMDMPWGKPEENIAYTILRPRLP